MNHDWAEIADCLRNEIAEYGKLLQLLERQQGFILQRKPEAILEMHAPLQVQVDVLHECRERREKAARDFAASRGEPEARMLRGLVPLVAAEVRPLMAALVSEINHLVRRVRRGLSLNQRLLACSVECQQEFMRRLWPSAFTRTYTAAGRVAEGQYRRQSALQTAG